MSTPMSSANLFRVADARSRLPPFCVHSGVAYTLANSTSEIIAALIRVPPGLMGPNAMARLIMNWTVNNNANAKTTGLRIGAIGAGTGGTLLHSLSIPSLVRAANHTTIWNRGASNSQISLAQSTSFDPRATSTSAQSTSAIETLTAGFEFVVTGQKATGTDTMTLEAWSLEIFP